MVKPYNGGTWTVSRYNNFIRSLLRKGTTRWGPKQQAFKLASVGKKINVLTGRLAEHFTCAGCGGEFPRSVCSADHIDPVVDPERGFQTWDEYIERMYCEVEGFQILCKGCHDSGKTAEEREKRKIFASIREKYPREEASWRNMKSRCDNPKATGYEYYGGRGITYSKRWSDFHKFYEDMGPRPEGTSLDRIDVNGDYTKENCRWATWVQQARNTTCNNLLEYDGELLCIQEWGERLGIKPNSILTRLRRGWTVEEALLKVPRNKPEYSGRVLPEDIEDLIQSVDKGMSISEWARNYGIDGSQANRLYHRFKLKTSEERERRKK